MPVVYVELDEKREKELNLRLNRNLGDWNWDLLKDFEIDLLKDVGFNKNELDKLINLQEDKFDADEEYQKIKEPKTKLGDIYQLGNHRLICGDAIKKEDVEKLMGGIQARLIFTDPPYNVDYKSQSGNSYSEGKYEGKKIFNDNKSDEDCLKFYINALKNIYDFSTDDACIYWWLAFNINGFINQLAFKESGWKLSQMIIWLKNSMIFSKGCDYHRLHEPCFFGWKNGKSHFSNKRICNLKDVFNLDYDSFEELSDVWYENRDKIIEYEHPTQKPVRLAERALKKNSEMGDIILDVFGGSGSTLIACEQLDRKCYMMELDPKYCDVIINRWEIFTNKKATKI